MQPQEKNKFGRSDLEVSAFGFGTAPVGNIFEEIDEKTSDEMFSAVKKSLPVDVAVCTAAVSDFKPSTFQKNKIKKDKSKEKIDLDVDTDDKETPPPEKRSGIDPLDLAKLGGIIMGARNMSELGSGITALAGDIQESINKN